MFILGIVLSVLFILFLLYLISIGAKKEHFGRAALETGLIYIISNMPVWLLMWAFISKSNNSVTWVRVFDNLETVLNAGDIFIYVSAILAPVVWTLVAYFKESHRVLSALYIISLILILPFSAFAFQQARLVQDVNQVVFNNSALFLYVVSLVLWYGATVYARFVENYKPGAPQNTVLDRLRGRNG